MENRLGIWDLEKREVAMTIKGKHEESCILTVVPHGYMNRLGIKGYIMKHMYAHTSECMYN